MDFANSTLEITTQIGCPVACVYCPQDKLRKNYHGADRTMTVETLKKCLEKIPIAINKDKLRYPRIEFSGFCEPFTNPNCSDLINLAFDKGFHDITLYTTMRGMKISDYEQIKHIPFAFVSIHLPDVDRMAKILVDENYFTLLGLIMDTFKLGFFAYGNIMPEVLEFIEKKEPNAFKGKYMWDTSIHSRAGNVDMVKPADRRNGHIKCSAVTNMEFNHNILLPNGDVVVCCMDFGLRHIVANLLTGKYNDIYTSEEHNKMVAGMYIDEMNSMCRICNYAVENAKN